MILNYPLCLDFEKTTSCRFPSEQHILHMTWLWRGNTGEIILGHPLNSNCKKSIKTLNFNIFNYHNFALDLFLAQHKNIVPLKHYMTFERNFCSNVLKCKILFEIFYIPSDYSWVENNWFQIYMMDILVWIVVDMKDHEDTRNM